MGGRRTKNRLVVLPILLNPSSVSQADAWGCSWLAGCYPASPSPLRRDQTPKGPAHSPCSQLHARPAGDIAATAGGLLPHRFSPDCVRRRVAGNAFCCGCSRQTVASLPPSLAVSWGNLPVSQGHERESGSSSDSRCTGPPATDLQPVKPFQMLR